MMFFATVVGLTIVVLVVGFFASMILAGLGLLALPFLFAFRLLVDFFEKG